MKKYKILSADDHTFEPSNLWVDRMNPKYGDKIPHLVSQEDGDFWWYGDTRLVGLSPGTHPGRRYEPDPLVREEIGATRIREEHLRPGAYDPIERLKDMDTDGIDQTIIYSTLGLHLYKIADDHFLTEVQKAYKRLDRRILQCKPAASWRGPYQPRGHGGSGAGAATL